MYAIELTFKLVVLVLLWAVLASPLVIAAYFVGKTMIRRGMTASLAAISYAVVVAFLIAPVPTPIITIFMPNGFALFDPNYYPNIWSGDRIFGQLRPWIGLSLLGTVIICYRAFRYFIHKRGRHGS